MPFNGETQAVQAQSSEAATAWPHAFVAAAVAVVLTLFVFRDTALSLVEIWWRSETFAHGFLIVPISLWLIWKKRQALAVLTPRVAPAVAPIVLLAALAWGVAYLVGVQIVQQLALVSLLILAVWSVLGHRVAWFLSFPLLFLFLGVPMGEDLVPPMMEFTATFTVKMLQLTGIPVYREGLFFVIPSGSWSVVEGCSGVRYIIASVTLGFLYAYLAYRTLWRRLLFIALSFVTPVVANGLRAYMIVMIGHLSDMKLAHGVDHLIYGWVFFGLVMLLLFWIGSFWSEPAEENVPTTGVLGSGREGKKSTNPSSYYLVALLIVGLAAGVQVTAVGMGNREATVVRALEAPVGANGWVGLESAGWGWSPKVLETQHRFSQSYTKEGRTVRIELALYPVQRQDAEAVNTRNLVVVQKDPKWRVAAKRVQDRPTDTGPSRITRYRLAPARSGVLGEASRQLMIWEWYRLGSRTTIHPYLGKLYTGLNLIYPGRTDGAYITLATEVSEDVEGANATLERFVNEMGGAIDQAIDAAVLGPALR